MARTGRPTTSPKVFRLQIRVDEETAKMLDDCAKAKKLNRSDIVREGIKVVCDATRQNKTLPTDQS